MHQINVTTGELLYTCDHDSAVTTITAAPEGNTVYAGLQSGEIAIWTGDMVLQSPSESATSQMPDNAPDAPPRALMTDSPIVTVENSHRQEEVADILCFQNYDHCCKHGKKCCSLCAECSLVGAACCRTGALCIMQCPRTCVKHCCCRICVKNLCIPACSSIWKNIKRLWQ